MCVSKQFLATLLPFSSLKYVEQFRGSCCMLSEIDMLWRRQKNTIMRMTANEFTQQTWILLNSNHSISTQWINNNLEINLSTIKSTIEIAKIVQVQLTVYLGRQIILVGVNTNTIHINQLSRPLHVRLGAYTHWSGIERSTAAIIVPLHVLSCIALETVQLAK